MSVYSYPFPTKNTGDAWSAAEHRLYIKGNMDFLNSSQKVDLTPDGGYTAITGTAASGPTSVGGGSSTIGYRYLGYSATADNWIHWCFPVHRMWNVNAGNERLRIWGTMDTNNTATKNIFLNIYTRNYAPGDTFDAGFTLAYTGATVVDNTALNLMVIDLAVSGGDNPDNEDDYMIIGIERKGTHVVDTASGVFRLITARYYFVMDS